VQTQERLESAGIDAAGNNAQERDSVNAVWPRFPTTITNLAKQSVKSVHYSDFSHISACQGLAQATFGPYYQPGESLGIT